MIVKLKRLVLFAAALFCVAAFPACSGQSPDANGQKLSIVTTVFPVYDWIRNVTGDVEDVEITYLLDNSVDLHSYQPTVSDMMKISKADLFVYVGGESDKWVRDALKKTTNQKQISLNLMEALGDRAREEEFIEGMEDPGEEDEGEEEEGPEYDEHVWLSLKNAKTLVDEIAKKLSEADPGHAASYEANAKAYGEKLTLLDTRYATAVMAASVKTAVFADRFPFLYLFKDYGLTYYAAFMGCSAETEASFETVKFLANKVDELSVRYIFTIETSDQKIAKTVRDTTAAKDQEILTVNSLQSITAEKEQSGVTYLSVMEENLAVFEKALK